MEECVEHNRMLSSIILNFVFPNPEYKPSIYFATYGGGLKVYSTETLETSTIVSTSENLNAVAYDSISSKVYFSSGFKIYRANEDGSNQELVLSTSRCKLIEYDFKSFAAEYDSQDFVVYDNIFADPQFYCLAFDWISGNLYGGTWGGYILACDTARTNNFTCATVLSGEREVDELALNPIEGCVLSCVLDSIALTEFLSSFPVSCITQLDTKEKA